MQKNDENLLRESSQIQKYNYCVVPLRRGKGGKFKETEITMDIYWAMSLMSMKPRTATPGQPACPRDPLSLPPQCRCYRQPPHLPTFMCALRSQTLDLQVHGKGLIH